MKRVVFVDQLFWLDGSRLSTDEPDMLFPTSFKALADL